MINKPVGLELLLRELFRYKLMFCLIISHKQKW